jgi:hypothetical protein
MVSKDSRILFMVSWSVSVSAAIMFDSFEKIKEWWISGYAFLISFRALFKAIA